MNLEKTLRKSGYDLIESPIRNHKPLQLWLKKSKNVVNMLHQNISDAFVSDVELNTFKDEALTVDYSNEQEYNFEVGLKLLEELLSTLGLGKLGLESKFKGGKKVTLSYNKSITLEVPRGEISNYLSTSSFKYDNSELIKNANRDNILIISGVLMAQNLKTIIETDLDIGAEVEAQLMEAAEGKVEFNFLSGKKLEMKSEDNKPFPIAVKAFRLDWDKGKFKKMTIITDNRKLFK